METPGSFCERIGVGVASAARKVSVARAVHYTPTQVSRTHKLSYLSGADVNEADHES